MDRLQDEYDSQLHRALDLPPIAEELGTGEFAIQALFYPSFFAECAITVVRNARDATLTVRTPRRAIWPFFWKRGGAPPSLLDRLLGRRCLERRALPGDLADMLHRLALTSCDLPDATTQYLDGMSVAVGIIDALGQSNGYRRHVEGDTDPRDRLIRALADSASRHIKRRVSKRGLAGVQQHL